MEETPQLNFPTDGASQDKPRGIKNKDANNQLWDDESFYQSILTPGSLHHKDQPMTNTDPLVNQLSDQAKIDAEIARIKATECWVTSLLKLKRLRERASHGFPEENEVGSKSYKI